MPNDQMILDLKAKVDELAAASYASGLADGKASVGSPGTQNDKLYSQVEVDGMLAPLNEKITGLENEIDALKNEMNANVDKAVKAKVDEMIAEFDSEEAAQNELAKRFREKFAPVVVETPVDPVPPESPVEPTPTV